MARPSKAKAIERLEKCLEKIPDLKEMERDSNEFDKWHRNTKIAIEYTFTDKSSKIEDFTNIRYSYPGPTWPTSSDKLQRDYARGLDEAFAIIESMIEEIQDYWGEENGAQISSRFPSQENDTLGSNRVFIVHGRDEGAKNTVARFLGQLKLEPVILNEEASRGKTIIEKFEHHAKVGFAVVLLTPDDEGALQGGESGPSPRARQNVIFELGYFIGRLGREYVRALTKGGDLEIPSDYAGVVYIPLDDQGVWKMELVKELKAAGFDVDANLAL